MFQKRIIEIVTFVGYWLVVVPFVHSICWEYQLLTLDMSKISEVASKYVIFFVCNIIVYMTIYRIVLWIYMRCKIADIKMSASIKNIKLDLEQGTAELEQQVKERKQQVKATTRNELDQTVQKVYQSLTSRDEVDKPIMAKKPRTPKPQRAIVLRGVEEPALQKQTHVNVCTSIPTIHTPKQMVQVQPAQAPVPSPIGTPGTLRRAPPPPSAPTQSPYGTPIQQRRWQVLPPMPADKQPPRCV